MATLQSPLVRSARPQVLISRFESDWTLLLSPRPIAQSSKLVAAFFDTLFCLEPKPSLIERTIQEAKPTECLEDHRENFSLLFQHSVRILNGPDQDRKRNVVAVLLPFLRKLLAKSFSNFDTITLLAGSLDKSDQIFTVCPLFLGRVDGRN